ncbi:hypothetical protein CPB83DRAFT_682938 [Crepidotus variabilis]|uniref:ATP-dependent DNA helicase n=1 Tax=Crepidotus variabilis TaxID=179855 RepID=A0A9P6E6W8_9AGAR|nr:hypothetical protein CPB83DRAFT_682938 [Crepidotus variabilis]
MPFGGLQLIISGDFFQLPPVPDKSHNRIAPVVFAFDAHAWDECIKRPIFLTQVFRQTDNSFIDILTNIRHGRIPDRDLQRLRELSRPIYYEDGIQATELYPLRREVQECNEARLAALDGSPVHYFAMDFAGCDVEKFPLTDSEAETLLERMIALPWVSLKVFGLHTWFYSPHRLISLILTGRRHCDANHEYQYRRGASKWNSRHRRRIRYYS